MDGSDRLDNGRRRLRAAITGTGGRLGGALKRIYSDRFEVLAFDRASLDLANEDQVRAKLAESEFDILINPAAMTSVDQCESEIDAANAVNTRAPEVMAEICREKGAKFIHVSTDYVFDGVGEGLRKEGDPTRPLGVYGESKRAGEQAVLAVDPNALVVRTSWVFGPERAAFPDSIVARALKDERVEAIADKWSSPTYADDFAHYLEPLLEKDVAAGILHLCNSGSCSWQEYGQAALDFASDLGLELTTNVVEPLRLEEMSQFVVPRPKYTAMDTARYSGFGFGTPRHWKAALGDYLRKQIRDGKFSGL